MSNILVWIGVDIPELVLKLKWQNKDRYVSLLHAVKDTDAYLTTYYLLVTISKMGYGLTVSLVTAIL